jgi:hypothetical protein
MDKQPQENSENYSDLENKKQDYLAISLQGLAGMIPVAGSIVAEIIGELIPNQRTDRIVAFLIKLDEKVAHIEKEALEHKLRETENIDLFEDACFQASRALTDEKLEYIANAFANSLTQEEVAYLNKKKLMWLLGELNENEIIILRNYSYPQYKGGSNGFYEKHRDIIYTPTPTNDSSDEERNEAYFKRAFRERLNQLGLIRPRYKKPKRNEFPEFDLRTGRIKSSGFEITPLGKLLVKFITQEMENINAGE